MVNLLTLLQRQLQDWQILLAQLEAQNATEVEQDYCRQYIQELEVRLRNLSN